MSITDLPVLSALRTKMQWYQERQRVLAENVANADTPKFKPSELVEPKFDKSGALAAGAPMGSLAMLRTSASHIAPSGGSSFPEESNYGFQTRPAGNSVNLEDEMQKSAASQMDYAAMSALYSKSLHLIKTAIGKA